MRKSYILIWVTFTMKLQPLVKLSLILILACNSKGKEWDVNVTNTINATLGKNVTIECTFKYPEKYHTKNAQLYWKARRDNNLRTYDKARGSIYIYHPNTTFVEDKYRGKTELIGKQENGNCSLMIFNITDKEPNMYLRIEAGDNYSFIKNPVSIYLSGTTPSTTIPNSTELTPNTNVTSSEPKQSSPIMSVAIVIPVVAALIIIFVVGFVFFRHRRVQPFTREDSGYYENFSRASSNQDKRNELCKKQDNKELPELKAFDDPIYINMTAPAGQMDQCMDQSMEYAENIYANMDNPK